MAKTMTCIESIAGGCDGEQPVHNLAVIGGVVLLTAARRQLKVKAIDILF